MKAIATLVFLALPYQVQSELGSATLHGRVLTKEGRPQPDIQVDIHGVNYPATLETEVRTDQNGEYSFKNLNPGEYVLFPYDLSGKYPLTRGRFMSDHPTRIVLASGKDYKLDLGLPDPAGDIEGSVLSLDGSGVSNASVVLCHVGAPDRSVEIHSSENGGFSYQVPSGEKLSILVRLPSGVAMQKTDVEVEPGKTKVLIFRFTSKPLVEGSVCIPFRPK